MWEVFYTPHTDDETIGMAGAIVHARSLGHAVLVVLVTDNQPSTRGSRLFADCDAFAERRREWKHAMRMLDVTAIQTWELPETQMLIDPSLMILTICAKILEIDHQYTVQHHHTVWGADDVHVEASAPTLAHVLCAEALKRFHTLRPQVHASLHAVYLYSAPMMERTASTVRNLSQKERRLKQRAIECFKPGSHSVGYGYASVPELFDGAEADPREFIQELN